MKSEATRNPFGENMDDDKFSQETAYFYSFSNGEGAGDALNAASQSGAAKVESKTVRNNTDRSDPY